MLNALRRRRKGSDDDSLSEERAWLAAFKPVSSEFLTVALHAEVNERRTAVALNESTKGDDESVARAADQAAAADRAALAAWSTSGGTSRVPLVADRDATARFTQSAWGTIVYPPVEEIVEWNGVFLSLIDRAAAACYRASPSAYVAASRVGRPAALDAWAAAGDGLQMLADAWTNAHGVCSKAMKARYDEAVAGDALAIEADNRSRAKWSLSTTIENTRVAVADWSAAAAAWSSLADMNDGAGLFDRASLWSEYKAWADDRAATSGPWAEWIEESERGQPSTS